MPDADHKRAEREICTDLGGKRTGNVGFNLPDCSGTPGFAIEVKLVPCFRYRQSDTDQAIRNSQPGEFPIVIQKQRKTGARLVQMSFETFKEIYNRYQEGRNL